MDLGRGEVWWADVPEPAGSAPGSRRPVIVVQNNAFNRSRLATVTVVALTGNVRLVDAPGNVLVPARGSGLPRDSVANVSQVLTIDRGRLSRKVGRLPPQVVAQLDDGLRLALDL